MKKTLFFLALIFFWALAPHWAAAADDGSAIATKLFLKASPHKANLPPVREGQARIAGTLDSRGLEDLGNGVFSGCSWRKSQFGIMGDTGEKGSYKYGSGQLAAPVRGQAWFYADYEKASGKVSAVGAYGNGLCGKERFAFFASSPLDGSFGNNGADGFELTAAGTGIIERKGSLEPVPVQITITGNEPLQKIQGQEKASLRYQLSIPPNGGVIDFAPDFDAGSGIAQQRGEENRFRVASKPVRKKNGYVFLYSTSHVSDYLSFKKPALPKDEARFSGNLNSTYQDGNMNISWKPTSISGLNERGTAWFYVDFDPESGEIIDARAFAMGAVRSKIILGFYEKYKGSFGHIGKDGFELQIGGVWFSSGIWQGVVESSEGPAVIFIRGKGNLLELKNGATSKFTYEIQDLPGEITRISNSAANNGDDRDKIETEIQKEVVTFDKGNGTGTIKINR